MKKGRTISKPAKSLERNAERVISTFGKLSLKERRQFINALAQVSDQGPTNPKLGNRDSRPGAQPAPPPTSGFGQATGDGEDYFRRPRNAPANYVDQPDSSVTPARVTLSVRMRNNPIKGLTFDRLVGYLDQWRLGFFRLAGMAWDTMERRDYQLQIVRPKRLKSVARHGYDVLTVEQLKPGQEQLAQQQKDFLANFYDNATVTTALNPDEEGGLSLLVRQMMDAVGKYYAVHEIVWQPLPDGTLTAKFIFCPIWWFEGTRGKLRFLPSEFQIYGNEMLPGEWVVTCGDGIMEACSVLYLMKYGPLKSWMAFLEKFGMPGIHGKTTAQKGSAEWNDFVEAVAAFGEEWATVSNMNGEITLVEAAKASGDGGFDKIVDMMDRKVTQLWRGADLGTQSSHNGTGASLQEDESEILETDDAKMIEETLAQKVSRFALAWKFGPDAPQLVYVKLRTTPRRNIQDDLAVDGFLAGFPDMLSREDVLERYSRPVPKPGDALEKPAAPAPGNGKPVPPQKDDDNPEFSNSELNADAATVIHEMISPLLKRLQTIAAIEDPVMQQHMIEKLLKDFPAIANAIQSDNSLADKLSPALSDALVKGLKGKTS